MTFKRPERWFKLDGLGPNFPAATSFTSSFGTQGTKSLPCLITAVLSPLLKSAFNDASNDASNGAQPSAFRSPTASCHGGAIIIGTAVARDGRADAAR